MSCRQMFCILLLGSVTAGCVKDEEDPPPVDDSNPMLVDNSDLWIYKETLRTGASVLKTPGTLDVSKSIVRVDSYRWSGFMGPTLIMEQEQRMRWDVDNKTDLDLQFEFPGLEVIDLPTVPADTITDLWVSSAPGPGVTVYRASVAGDDYLRLGIGGVMAVRDTCEWEPREIEEQGTFFLMEPPYEVTTANALLIPERVEGGGEDCEEDEDPCWRPFLPGEHTLMVTQHVAVNPTWNLSEAPPSYADCDDEGEFFGYKPPVDEISALRHGGLNEFQTISPATLLRFTVGTVGRLNFGSISHEPHTLSLGGLMAKDPVTGEISDQVYLEPGQGTYRLWTPMDQPPGEYLVQCIDHDHGGLDQALIIVSDGSSGGASAR